MNLKVYSLNKTEKLMPLELMSVNLHIAGFRFGRVSQSSARDLDWEVTMRFEIFVKTNQMYAVKLLNMRSITNWI